MKMLVKIQCQSLSTIFILLVFTTSIATAETLSVTTGKFPSVSLLETEFTRGESTKEDVRRILGEPNGNGGAQLPTAVKTSNVWFYEDIEMTGTGSSVGGILEFNMRMQYLLIFFDEDKFDGFMWWTNVEEAHAEIRD